ncbi:hypothetical protein [Thermocrispum municipale]|uniref:hypothetical protein n=1 Tax=Thermocrispum municipale TaxID=37926 RepID=UPI0004014802|nr:hypothetical protein [Thermocrispum municipale]
MYESTEQPGGHDTPAPGQPTQDLLGDNSTAEALVRNAQRNRDDFHYGDDRAISNPPNWPSYSSRELYEGAVNNNDPGSAEELGALWMSQGKQLSEAADALYEAITQLGGVWVGKASGAAQGALVGVANASSTAGDAARTMGKRMQDQALAAAEVKKMPPPKDFDVDRALAASLAGGPAALAADMKKQADEARAVQQEQQRYMNAYTKAMAEVDSSTPSFAPESIGLKPVEQEHSATSSRSQVHGFGGGESRNLSSIGGNVDGMNVNKLSAGNFHAGSGSGSHGGSGAIFADDVRHAAHEGPVSASGTAQVTNQGSGPSTGAALGTAALGAGLGYAGAKAFNKAGGRHQARKFDEPEPQEYVAEGAKTTAMDPDELAAQGAATGTAQVPEPNQPLPNPAQPGATSAVAAGDPQHQQQMQAKAAQAQMFQQQQAAAMQPGPVQPMGGTAGMGGGMAGAAGAGAGEAEDKEHKAASYLIQPDPDDVFGPTEAVTSGVIGADFEDDDE